MKFYRIKALVWHYLYTIKRNPSRLIDMFFWPVFDLVLWGFLTIYLSKEKLGVSFFTSMVLGALIFWSIFYRTVNEIPFQVLDDIWSHNLKNLLITPLTLGEFLVALVLASFIKLFLTLIVLLPVAFLLYAFNILSFGLMALLLFADLLLFCYALGVLIVGAILRFGNQIAFLSWITATLIQPLACVFYPRSVLPPLLKNLSYLMPPSYVFESLRSLLKGEGFSLGDLMTSFLLNFFYFFFAFFLFKFLYNWARRKGTLVKF